ncbi:MAG TPA: amino acid racemase [Candidatus Aquilonibacter sp.]|nr:amino acid racemase [Candidatus Aquilonibacter sp.]
MATTKQALVPGILGGMGPLAHIELERRMLRVSTELGARTDQDHPMWVLVNATHTPDRTASLHGKAEHSGDFISMYASLLEHGGADFMVVVCNTAHAFYEEVAATLSIPWIHIIDVTAEHIHRHFPEVDVVGVLQTDGCGKAGMYAKHFGDRGFRVVTPYATDDAAQAGTMEIAYHPEWGVKATGDVVSPQAVARLRESIEWLATHGAQIAVTGCTEYSAAAALLRGPAIAMVDPLDVLARRTVELAMGHAALI